MSKASNTGEKADRIVGADKTRPESADRRVDFLGERRLGSSIGHHVVRGLEVYAVPGATNLLQIEAGLAITGMGEPLMLDQPLRLRLTSTSESVDARSVAPCGNEVDFALPGEGYCLISLVPTVGLLDKKATGRAGQPEASNALCQLEDVGVLADRIPAAALPTILRRTPPSTDAPALSRARSQLAQLCLGEAMHAVPPGHPKNDFLQTAGLTSPERVALAIVAWSDNGLRFVDRWSVRRSATPDTRSPGAPPCWPLDASRAMQREAMQRQFQEHLDELLLALNPSGNGTASLVAGDWFVWLPAVGILPRANTEGGLSAKIFFSTLPARSLFLEHAAVENILRDGMACPPIDLTAESQQLVWLYQLVEDHDVLVYVSGHLPPTDPVRLDLARYDATLHPDGEQ